MLILDPGDTGYAAMLESVVRRRFSERTLDSGALVILNANNVSTRDLKSPIVGVYFGHPTRTGPASAATALLTSESRLVIPAVPDTSEYHRYVPAELRPISGFLTDGSPESMERLSNLVLEGFDLLRSARRVFISYRRCDSSVVALQLYNALDERGFDVFLDTHGVRAGDPFQEVLWHRLTDSDLMLLLDTPGYLGSTWTVRELSEAAALSVGILQVLWPGHARNAISELCVPLYLLDGDIAANGLTTEALCEVLEMVEHLRARSVAARESNLIREFRQAADDLGFHSFIEPGRYVIVDLPGSRRIAAFPSLGVPDAVRYEDAERLRAEALASRATEAVILYDDRGIRPRWLDHLAWLDKHLPIRGVQAIRAPEWLSSL